MLVVVVVAAQASFQSEGGSSRSFQSAPVSQRLATAVGVQLGELKVSANTREKGSTYSRAR
jgi:hypothetical protein